jgi:hypothetical protein
MSEHSYKCQSAKATATRIWNADFYHGSFNELVESKDPDVVIASVGLSEVSGPSQKLSMVTTLHNHPWCAEIIAILSVDILNSDPPLLEWSIDYKHLSWTVTMTRRY